jgi:hypothetical protein
MYIHFSVRPWCSMRGVMVSFEVAFLEFLGCVSTTAAGFSRRDIHEHGVTDRSMCRRFILCAREFEQSSWQLG